MLEGTFLRHIDVVGLFGCQNCKLGIQGFQVVHGYLLIEFFRELVNFTLLVFVILFVLP